MAALIQTSATSPAPPPGAPKRAKRRAVKSEPEKAAASADLIYVNDDAPGLSRQVRMQGGKPHFSYRDAQGRPVRDAATLDRIRKLAIPPAYRDVWICAHPEGHLQATGRDARGRLQYRYHPRWREVRDVAKFGHMMVFGRALPHIRAQVAQDLALPGLPRAKVLAAIVRLLETTLMRVGNEEYAQSNKSFGITTLRTRHAHVKGRGLTLDFRGKHGIEHHIDLADRRLAGIVQRCQDLPGQALFQFLDAEGARHGVSAGDVNDYLRAASGAEVTAKDFRTWSATNLAALALQTLESEGLAPKKGMLRAIEAVAKLLGNTPTICRKCYIHPAIFDGYLDGSLLAALKRRAGKALQGDVPALSPEEAAVMRFLGKRLKVAA